MTKEREALKLALNVLINRVDANNEAITAIREALAQPEQEITDSEMFKIRSAYRKGFEHGMEQAPQRKPLTDEKIAKIALTPCAVVGSYVHTFARAIEAAHGIKEG